MDEERLFARLARFVDDGELSASGPGEPCPHRELNKLEFREPVKFQLEFLFVRNPNLLCNGCLPLVQDFKYSEKTLWVPVPPKKLLCAINIFASSSGRGQTVNSDNYRMC